MSNQQKPVESLTTSGNKAKDLLEIYLKYHALVLSVYASNKEFRDVIQEMTNLAGIDNVPFLLDGNNQPITSYVQTEAILKKLGYLCVSNPSILGRFTSIGPHEIGKIEARDILKNHFLQQYLKNLDKIKALELSQDGGWRQRIREWWRRDFNKIIRDIVVYVVGTGIIALIRCLWK